MSFSVWEPTLWAYSAALEEHRTVLQGVEMDVEIADVIPVPPSFVAPADPPPMPDEYVPWARTLLETTEGLIQFAKDLALRSELRRGDRPLQQATHTAQVAESTLNALL
jgi:hypothetical protein